MPIWPFRRRRRARSDAHDPEAKPLADEKQPSASAPHSRPPSRIIPSSQAQQSQSRRASLHDAPARPSSKIGEKAGAAPTASAGQSRRGTANKENVPPPNYASREDITALPMQQQLERSPHLRPVDLEKPQIPYNFRPHSTSQTSVQRHDALARLSKSNTLRSKRSTTDYSAPTRRFSTKSKRDPLREEEIRSMTTPIPIPKRPGDGPLRRDSKKVRGLNGDSHVSLPPEGSIHSSMSGVVEQRGWEVGSIAAVFSPRPAVRLSGLPQYVSSSLPPSSSGILYRIDSMGSPRDNTDNRKIDAKERRKRRTVGKDADELGASDLRAIMEREAKRKEKRQVERQERLERKLRSAGRERADSERKRRNSDERVRAEQTRARVEQELQSRGVLTPPSEVHPALRDNAVARPELVGLGIGQSETPNQPLVTDELRISDAADQTSENPFTDAAETPAPEVEVLPRAQVHNARLEEKATLYESPFEEPYVGTAQAIRMSMTHTPPLSPVYGNRAPSSVSQLAEIARLESASQPSVTDLAPPPRLSIERRNSDQISEKRTASWAAFFRRGGTFRRSSQGPTSEGGSFSNTSRESMRNHPIPAHLVGNDFPRPSTVRSASGTPVRTQSKFREDLPDVPISPPDSRTQTPDVTTASAAVVGARRAARATPMDIPENRRDAEGDVYMSGRNDTPLSAVSRGHVAMSASLASIGSEGSWLASGGSKRQSNESALSRSFSKRNAEFTASYEELGGADRDAEYLSRNKASRPASRSNLIGASPDEESEEEAAIDTTSGEPPLTVHGSVRRKPTLVQRDPRLVSREGLVQEYAAQEATTEPVETPDQVTPEDENVSGLQTPDQSDDEFHDAETPEVKRAVELGRAVSVDMKTHTARHSRQFSAGSARLLDMPSKRASGDITREATPSPLPRTNPLSRSNTPN